MSDRAYVGLVDCNNFFVSCERLFRPDLATKPVVVLSSNDGCIISRSREVKELGIPMGIPYFEIKPFLIKNEVTVFSSNFALYRDISSRVMETLESVVLEFEPYSIDEAFFTVSRSSAQKTAHTIRERVSTWVGVPVSVGIAETKTLAKLMSERAKRADGTALIDAERTSILDVSLGEVWGVGPSARTRLEKQGMHTVRDVLARRPDDLRAVLGVQGERLHFELSGIPASVQHASPSMSMMSTRSFGTRVRTYAALESAVTYHLSRIAEKLRSRDLCANGMTLYLTFENAEHSARSVNRFIPFPTPLSDTRLMATHVLSVLRATYDSTMAYRKAGIIAQGIVEAEGTTASLFSSAVKGAHLMSAMDRLNARHGADTVHLGTLSQDKTWDSKRTFLSPSYTTSWKALKTVQLTDISHVRPVSMRPTKNRHA